ncbi:hypothetical protein DU80_13155 [Methanosarcina mazei]|uniref:Uncharacterized protein n=1 Tax=Methanosarcina mazei TaxID=2209 RepID=A0A0F8CGZ1_METMZ|nr:hypothetical protein DU47_06040 [Methanosarcina mazei]MDY0388074.1 hypothetical protein [Methanolobus sp.]KKF99915.1 hypothetical protein DU40_16110 [Methanosarcina mazei]KKG04149.1 hypothetical protein DU31_01160 [Methanosarcina mazei]KKH40330.1 hypothetical protein DU54_14250 [Methanosarcina mazei]
MAGLSPSDAASFLKNYIDYKPDRDVYGLVIQAPAADGQILSLKPLYTIPKTIRCMNLKS